MKAAHEAMRSLLTIALSPQVMATRLRQAFATVTTTAGLPPRTPRPLFVKNGHALFREGMTCGRYAGGTETVPRTTRFPPAWPERSRPTIPVQLTVGGAFALAAIAAKVIAPARANNAIAAPVRVIVVRTLTRWGCESAAPRGPRIRAVVVDATSACPGRILALTAAPELRHVAAIPDALESTVIAPERRIPTCRQAVVKRI